jgi:ankyrin repeat protein
VLFVTGDTLLHLAARTGNEEAALFLAKHGGNGSIANQKVS